MGSRKEPADTTPNALSGDRRADQDTRCAVGGTALIDARSRTRVRTAQEERSCQERARQDRTHDRLDVRPGQRHLPEHQCHRYRHHPALSAPGEPHPRHSQDVGRRRQRLPGVPLARHDGPALRCVVGKSGRPQRLSVQPDRPDRAGAQSPDTFNFPQPPPSGGMGGPGRKCC